MRVTALRFAFFCPPYAGHLNPMLALAAALQQRGHTAVFVGAEDVAATVRQAGFAFEAVGTDTHPTGTVPAMEARLAALRGLLGIGAVIQDVAAMTDMLCRAGPDALRRIGADAVVFDQLEPAGGLLARHLGLPCASVANALMLEREPYVPPPFTDWAYARTAWARERNLGGYRVSDWMMRRVGATLARWSAAFGLAPRRRAEQCVADCQIGQLSAPLDFPRDELPGGFHYAGPLRPPLSAEPDWQPPPQARGALAFVSLGSLQGGRAALIGRICRACRELGLTPLVAHGGRLSEAQAAALPGAPLVAQFVPQRRVLGHCRVAVSHGGMNTVLDALAAGVPLALVPLAMEQGAIAQRVVRAGAGVRVAAPVATVRSLRRAIAHTLQRPGLREAVQRIGASLQAGGGAPRAALLIEAHACR